MSYMESNDNTFGTYQIVEDCNNNEKYTVNTCTGEITESMTITVPVGTKIYTPEQQAVYEAYKEREARKHLQKIESKGKKFIFAQSAERYGLKPQTVTRLIYLSTFVKYGNDILMKTQRTPMVIADLPSILQISRKTADSFLKEVVPNFINIDNNNNLHINTDVFYMGAKSMTDRHGMCYQKIYIEYIRILYEKVKGKYAKQLGYIFDLLPYINIDYNVLCFNPYERDLSKIDFMTLSDFCEAINYDLSNISRLLKIYRSIHFDVDGKEQLFCSVVYDGVQLKNAHMFINPNILYRGVRPKDIEILGRFCEIEE